MEYVLIIGHDMDYSQYNFNDKYVIGVDEGAYTALKAGIKVDLAVGDFDSTDEEKLKYIESKTKTVKLNREKDETDTSAALKFCDNADRITILGGIQGKRIEHFIANLKLMENNHHIQMLDNNSLLYITDSSFSIKKSKYKYISLFALRDTIISLEGFQYNLNNYNLKISDPLTISNQLVNEVGIVTIKGGKLLVIQSRED